MGLGEHGLRLGIDMDGVIADFNEGWTSRYNRDFPERLSRPLAPTDIVEWDAPVDLTHFADMGEFWRWARTCGEGRSIFHVLHPYPGAIDAMRQLADDGHQLVIVTTKPHFAVDDTHDWLARHDVPHTELHIVDDKTTVTCDVYLDDANHNLEALLEAHRQSLVCRYVRPWNTPVPGAVDVDGWDEFTAVVRTRV